LIDYFQGDFKKERNILLVSISEGIPGNLINKKDVLPYDILSSQLVQKLVQFGFTDQLAKWAVNSWAVAFGIIAYDEIKDPVVSQNTISNVQNPQERPSITPIDEMDILGLTAIQFKLYLKELFEHAGYKVGLTPPSNNFVDFIISGNQGDIVVVTKKYSKSVSDEVIRRLLTAKEYYRAKSAIVIATSSFTNNAINLANNNDVLLWDMSILITISKSEEMEEIFFNSVCENLVRFGNPENFKKHQITAFSIQVLEGVVEKIAQDFLTKDALTISLMIANFSQDRKNKLVYKILKKYNVTSTLDEISHSYNEFFKNVDSGNKDAITIGSFVTKINYENMIVTLDITGTCPICGNSISATPIDKEVYDPKKTYNMIISCQHCSFQYTAENIISDSTKEKIFEEAATYSKKPEDFDLFE
jgi:restriction system protein